MTDWDERDPLPKGPVDLYREGENPVPKKISDFENWVFLKSGKKPRPSGVYSRDISGSSWVHRIHGKEGAPDFIIYDPDFGMYSTAIRALETKCELSSWPGASPEHFGEFYQRIINLLRGRRSSNLEDVIEDSKKLLELKDGWDEGRKGYERRTWERAIAFLRANFAWLSDYDGLTPTIGAGPEGAIDLHWKTAQVELLIEIPPHPAQLAPYYGDNKRGHTIKGQVRLDDDQFGLVLLWLSKPKK